MQRTQKKGGGGKEKGGEKGTIAANGQSMHVEKEEGLNAEAEFVLFFKNGPVPSSRPLTFFCEKTEEMFSFASSK